MTAWLTSVYSRNDTLTAWSTALAENKPMLVSPMINYVTSLKDRNKSEQFVTNETEIWGFKKLLLK